MDITLVYYIIMYPTIMCALYNNCVENMQLTYCMQGLTTIGAGRAVAPPLFDGSKLIMLEWLTTAYNVSTHYDSSRVSVPY